MGNLLGRYDKIPEDFGNNLLSCFHSDQTCTHPVNCVFGVILNCSETLGRETHDRQRVTLLIDVSTALLVVFMCRRNGTVSAKDRLYTVKANSKYLQ